MTALKLDVWRETWPIAGAFVIARGAKTEAEVVVAVVSDSTACDGAVSGRGECVPYARYGESAAGVHDQLAGLPYVPSRPDVQSILSPGAARNALDCALWDYEAKHAGISAARLAGLAPLAPLTTAYTISLAAPGEMAAKARMAAAMPLLKLKLGGPGDIERMQAVRAARPEARLIVDANEAWPVGEMAGLMQCALETGVELIEQPLPAGSDEALEGMARTVPLCADESAHTAADLPALKGRYDAVNIKLDKSGGLTGAMAMADAAGSLGLKVMAGCMVATSLAMAPAVLLGQKADWVDLDGPLLLARDREHALTYDGATIHPPSRELWG